MTTDFSPESDAMRRQASDGQRTVAIIEDEKDLVDIYVRLCILKNMSIAFIAYNGCEAISNFKRCPLPDVILIDHRMPTMTGIEAMKTMLDINPKSKFIFLSADDNIRDDALRSGAKAFLKKPAGLMEIYTMITKVIAEP